MSALIFVFVFGVIAGLPSEGEPYLVFAFAGMTAWNTFANVLTKVSASLLGNGQMISKIYFPRLIVSAVSFSHFDRIWESRPCRPSHFPRLRTGSAGASPSRENETALCCAAVFRGLGPGRLGLFAGPVVRDDGNLPGLARMGYRVLAGLAADSGGPGTRSGTDDFFVDGALSRRRARHSGGAPVRPVHQPGGLVDDEHQAQ